MHTQTLLVVCLEQLLISDLMKLVTIIAEKHTLYDEVNRLDTLQLYIRRRHNSSRCGYLSICSLQLGPGPFPSHGEPGIENVRHAAHHRQCNFNVTLLCNIGYNFKQVKYAGYSCADAHTSSNTVMHHLLAEILAASAGTSASYA